MAEIPTSNIPNVPAGAVPPPKKETGKVQPKKETVRISLPPKPSTAPTIKLPTLPPGGPTGASSGAIPSASAPTQAVPRATAAPVTTPSRAAAPAAPQALRVAPAAAPTINSLDRILIIAAAVAAVFAVGTVIWMMLIPTT
jgi:hypothetical protein